MGTPNRIRGPLTLDSSFVMTAAGNYVVVNETALIVNKTSGAATGVTLPAAPPLGRIVLVIDGKGDAGSNNITVSPAAGTIIGSSTYVISENYGAVLFMYNGTEWDLLTYYTPLSAPEVAFLSGVTAGTVTASKALVAGSNSAIDKLNITNATIPTLISTNGTITTLNSTTTTITNGTVTNGTVTTLASTNATVTTLNSTTETATTLVGAGSFSLTDVGPITAANSAIGNAAPLTHTVNIVSGANDTAGVILPVATTGRVLLVYSSQATNGLKVYPQVNSAINNGTANAAIVIEGQSMAIFIATNAVAWSAMYTVNA